MQDYVYPSIFFSYFLFALFAGGAAWFCYRTISHGYFGPASEDVKYRMLADEETDDGR